MAPNTQPENIAPVGFEVANVIERYLDTDYLIETLSALARVPTDVPLGHDVFMEPDDPKLVHYVQEVVRPELQRIGIHDLIDAPRNNLVIRMGSGESGRTVLILNYTVAQHHQLMQEPFSGKVANAREFGVDEPAVFGRGVGQSKAHQAVMLTVLRMLRDSGVELGGRLYWGINNEGRSSHTCSNFILGTLGERPDFCLIQLGTNLTISLGNRGRVDVNIHVRGRSSHSSAPGLGLSAIEGAHLVLQRLKALQWPDQHELLGARHAIPYQVRYEPLAPHTLPSDAYIKIDRRLLPGDDPTAAADEIKGILGDLSPYEVTVEPGFFMLPAMIDANNPWVLAFQRANYDERGKEADAGYRASTFDAGGPYAAGVPTIVYGASGGVWPLGPDFVSISDVETEARIIGRLILSELGGRG